MNYVSTNLYIEEVSGNIFETFKHIALGDYYKDSSINRIGHCCWHPDGNLIAVKYESGLNKNLVVDVPRSKVIGEFANHNILGWDPSGDLILTQDNEGNCFLNDYEAGSMEELPTNIPNGHWAFRFFKDYNVDGSYYIEMQSEIPAQRQRASIKVFSSQTEELLFEFPRLEAAYSNFAWHPTDPNLIATCAGIETQIWRRD
jgi:WD40 repeat protein